jgi:hypothetical protein
MRRLTLILSDLYLHEDAAQSGGPRPPELPAFEWLLRVSDPPRHIADWRAWLSARMPGDGCESVISVCTLGLLEERLIASTWFATPVHLEARLDHVRLVDRGLLRLDAAERAAACTEFARAFGPTHALHEGGERTFYLSGLPPVDVRTVDPARLLGCDIGPAVPGAEATELRRLGAEIEMWLHGAAFNAARERAGRPRVSSLWLWRGAPAQAHRPGAPRFEPAFLGGDPLIAAMIRHVQQRDYGPPTAIARLETRNDHVVVEFAPLSGGPAEALPALEENWFAPAKAALTGGSLDEIELVANDRVFRVASNARWRFWRRQPHWLARLGGSAKA